MDSSNMLDLRQYLPPSAVRSVVVTITPEDARRLRDTAHFDRQRNISPSNVARLAAEMAKGQFTPGTQIYLCVLPDGSERIVNGNHTLEAVAACGVPQVLTVTRKWVKDEGEAGRIYAVFDIQKLRTWRDSLRATGSGEEIPNASAVLSAIGIIENKFAHSVKPNASRLDRIGRLEEYRESAELFAAAVENAPRNSGGLMKRAAVMAVALETLRYQPSLAFDFWRQAAHDDGLVNGQPEKAMLSWLRNQRGAGGGSAQREHCRAVALAWNAAFRGATLSFVKPNQMGAFYLLGTPYARGLEG